MHERELSQRKLRSVRDPRNGGSGQSNQQDIFPQKQLRNQPQQQQKRSQTMIEIAPGLRLCLRGAEETMDAIASDRLASEFCTCCQELLHCVRDADYVLCPSCKVVSPLVENEYSNRHSQQLEQHRPSLSYSGGDCQNGLGSVGLGMKHDDLCAYRVEKGLD